MIRSELDVLLDKVSDDALRADLKTQIDRLKERRSYGLVFERHIPERVRLPLREIRVGARVVSRDREDNPTWEVLTIDDGVATLTTVRDAGGAYVKRGEHGDLERAPIDSLVVISEFGEPVLPGLRHLGSLERGRGRPSHVVIKGENHHALEALRFTHAGKIDCIYIDPPYNSGARDWKYNNDYVDENDAYRHSKWLAFMERRLTLAKELLNPDDSVLVVTVDENEYLRLGLLLEQTFAGRRKQMVASVTNPAGAGRATEFARTDEYLFFVRMGDAAVAPEQRQEEHRPVTWDSMRRSDLSSVRRTRPAQFYPIYVNSSTGLIQLIGDALPREMRQEAAPLVDGCIAVFPVRPDGTEMNWGITAEPARERLAAGYLRAGRATPDEPQKYVISYLTSGIIQDIADGEIEVSGRAADGSVIAHYVAGRFVMPTTNWNRASHDAQRGGTQVLKAILPDRRFPFPKSLYAVEDTIRFFVKDKPNAVVLDFFAGSGTTAHAVMRLNRQDGGRRQSIMVTNNEVSVDEAANLRGRGFRPGDPEWEALGIFEHITRPRVESAVTGKTPQGEPIKGDYKFTDEFPMAEGFEENVEFLDIAYLDADNVDLGFAFDHLAALFWLRAGAKGPIARADEAGERVPFVWTDYYGVIFDTDHWRAFVSKRPQSAQAALIVTYSPAVFASIAAELPVGMDVVRLYDSYLSRFTPERPTD